MKSLFYFFVAIFFVLMLGYSSCKVEDLLPDKNMTITFPLADTVIQYGDSIPVSYKADSKNLSLVYLMVDDEKYDSLEEAEGTFNFKPLYQGSRGVHAVACYEKGYKAYSDTLVIGVFIGHPPDIILHCERIDGEPSYYVGEQLSVTILPEWEWQDISHFKPVTLWLNGDSLGTLYGQPFTFQTPVILNPNNTVNVLMVDTTNFKYDIELPLPVPVNTPPELEFEFDFIFNVMQGYFYTTDNIKTRLHGEDDLRIHYVDYYLDDQYFSTDTVNSGYFSFREMNFGFLPAGEHTTQCIAFDDRGLSTSSPILGFIIYKMININEQIVDIISTSNPTLIYAAGTGHLLEINPEEEVINRSISLPFAEPTAIFASNEWQKLFIAFRNGKLVYVEYGHDEFMDIETDTISNIEDLVIDEDYNMAILISNLKMMVLNMGTGEHFINVNTTLYEGSKMVYSKPPKNVIAGGNPHVSSGYVYKYQLTPTSIDRVGQSQIGGYVDNLILSPNNKDLMITTDQYNTGYPSYDITNYFALLGKYELFHSNTGAYSLDGNTAFLGSALEKEVVSFNSASFNEQEHYYIPFRDYNEINFIQPDQTDSKIILVVNHDDPDKADMIFVSIGR